MGSNTKNLTKPKIVTVVQARTGSSRLPNKVLMPVADSPLLVHTYRRIRAAKLSGTVVVATTTHTSDDLVEQLCHRERIPCFRGHPVDLLSRHYVCGVTYGADVVVKIPSDCPLIDPAVIDRVIQFYLQNNMHYDYVSNLHPASYPDGNDVEVMPMHVLKTAWKEARKDFEREHTTPFIWEKPSRFRIGNVIWETGRNFAMSHRWTIDYLEDYIFIKMVYEQLFQAKPFFTISDILGLLEARPEIAAVNQKYAGVNWYRHHLDQLKTVSANETRFINS